MARHEQFPSVPLQLDLFMRDKQLSEPVPGWMPDYLLTKDEIQNRRDSGGPQTVGISDSSHGNRKAPASSLDHQVGGSHYRDLKIQPAEFLRQLHVPHLEGEAIYRIVRHKQKAGREDLEKAIHTLQIILELDYGK